MFCKNVAVSIHAGSYPGIQYPSSGMLMEPETPAARGAKFAKIGAVLCCLGVLCGDSPDLSPQ